MGADRRGAEQILVVAGGSCTGVETDRARRRSGCVRRGHSRHEGDVLARIRRVERGAERCRGCRRVHRGSLVDEVQDRVLTVVLVGPRVDQRDRRSRAGGAPVAGDLQPAGKAGEREVRCGAPGGWGRVMRVERGRDVVDRNRHVEVVLDRIDEAAGDARVKKGGGPCAPGRRVDGAGDSECRP